MYAKDTSVSVEKSRAEIETILSKYGATSFAYMTNADGAKIGFEANNRKVMFVLPLPRKDDRAFLLDHRSNRRPPDKVYAAWEQACRSRWRSLALAIKAKLESVACGITSFEDEFLAHIMMPDGLTVGETLRPRLAQIYEGQDVPLLPGPRQ